jgi:hypothetical protein
MDGFHHWKMRLEPGKIFGKLKRFKYQEPIFLTVATLSLASKIIVV